VQRILFYTCTLVLSLFVGTWLFVMPVHAAAPILVTTTDDSINDDASCSLREAIMAANTDSAVGGCTSGSGADTIIFTPTLPRPAIFVLSQSGVEENEAQTGDLDIIGMLVIRGDRVENNSPTIMIDGNGTDRVFEILSGAQVTMTGMTIRNGNPGAGANGGGVLVNLTARLTLTASQVISNSALNGGGLQTLGQVTMIDSSIENNQGGGIHNDGGLLTLNDVQVANNRGGYGIRNQNLAVLILNRGLVSTNQGGGIYNATATATISNTLIMSNTGGSGVYNTGIVITRLTIRQSTILSNTATSGGGLLNEGIGASAEIFASRISGNQATNAGGGLFNNGIMTVNNSTLDHNQARAGGGLHHFGGHLALTNDTISQNGASDNGGGLYNGSSAVLNAVTFAENRADGEGGNVFNDEAQLSIENSIVAHAKDGDNCVNSNGFLTSLGYNLESTQICNFTATGDLTNTDPLLGPLQDNGGPMLTHALLVGSPAIDQGATVCPATDQRGVTRPQGLACDSGAYEWAAIADLAVTASVAPPTVTVGSKVTYTLTISNLGPAPATALTLTNELPHGATFITATLFGGACAVGSVVTCTVPALAAGMPATVTIVVTAPVIAGPITNTAAIMAATLDLNVDNNRAVAVIAVAASGADLIRPGPVGNLTATAVTTQGATLTWTPAMDNVGVAGYSIYGQRDGSGQLPFLVGLVDATVTTYTVATLAPDTGYQLWVTAFDLAGNAALLTDSVPVSITTLSPPVGGVQISIEPPLPTAQDAISITVSGLHHSSCTPQYQTHQRTGDRITIQSMPSPEPFCLPAEFSWHYTIGLGLLDAGRYTVTHTVEAQVDTAVFTVTTAAPGAPIIQVDERQAHAAMVGELFQFVIKATGIPAPTYALQQAAPGMTIDPVSGQLTWTPSAVGVVTVIVQAANSRGSATYILQITVDLPNNGQHSSFLPLVVKG